MQVISKRHGCAARSRKALQQPAKQSLSVKTGIYPLCEHAQSLSRVRVARTNLCEQSAVTLQQLDPGANLAELKQPRQLIRYLLHVHRVAVWMFPLLLHILN